jgi:DNA gyrase subunit A
MALYKISQLEIDAIIGELTEKKTEAEKIRKLLGSVKRLWNVVQTELQQLSDQFTDKRRTAIGSSEEIVEFDASAYIVRENTNVVLTREGWVKRVGRLQSIETTRIRDGDAVLDVIPGSTLDSVIFFASDGIAFTLPIEMIPVSSGYGEPLSKHVKMGDGVSIVAAITTDSRFTPSDQDMGDGLPPAPYFIALTAHGQIMRLPLSPFRGPSTKAGRKYCRPADGDKVVWIELVRDATSIFVATKQARVTHFSIDEVPILSGAGKGVRGIKRSDPKDEVLGAAQMARPSDCLRVMTSSDKVLVFGQMKYELSTRGGKGIRAAQRSTFTSIVRPDIVLADWTAIEGKES